MSDPSLSLEQALAAAHIPTLLVVLAQLTGDDAYASEAHRPAYVPLGDEQGGLSPELQAWARARALEVLPPFLAGDRSPPGAPAPDRLRRLMSFLAGAELPDRYIPFLTEELMLGEDPRRPEPVGTGARPVRALIIGAGMSGLLAAIRLSQAGVAVQVLEKNADVGGTWLENSYPGCRVDVPSHLYSYAFESSAAWPDRYSTRDVLLNHFREVAARHDLRGRIRIETRVEEAVFDEAHAIWRVRAAGADGRVETFEAELLVAAAGQLNTPRLPGIPGLETFGGEAFHSARWRHDVDLAGKRVAVIGTGASAFQIVPAVAGVVEKLSVFQRTPPWLGPTPDYHDPVPEAERWLLRHVPLYAAWRRFWLFWTMTDGLYEAARIDPDWTGGGSVSLLNDQLRELFAERMRAQLGGRPDLADAVVPAYPVGAKRTVRDNGVWLSALQRDNVELVTAPIRRVVREGVETGDGRLHPADVIVYATGFRASEFLHGVRIVGRGGRELHEAWDGEPRAYLGLTAPGFPNFFMLYGPNTNIVVNGSIIFMSECAVRYLVGAVRLLQDRKAAALEVRAEVFDAFNARVDAANAAMAWGAQGVVSWYKSASGRVSQNWPWPLVDYWEATRGPDPGDFHLTEAASEPGR